MEVDFRYEPCRWNSSGASSSDRWRHILTIASAIWSVRSTSRARGVGAVLFVALAVGWFALSVAAAVEGGSLCSSMPSAFSTAESSSARLTSARRKANFLAIGVLLAVLCPSLSSVGMSSPCPRAVRGFGDEHPDSAGSHSDTEQRGGLLSRLSIRRRRADLVSVPRFSS